MRTGSETSCVRHPALTGSRRLAHRAGNRAEGAREGEARAVQDATLDHVRAGAAEDRHREDRALPPWRGCTAEALSLWRKSLSEVTRLQAGGASLEARFIGRSPPGAPTLVFLHEGLGSAAQWKDFPDRVCQRVGLGALVYSRRGYGASDGVPLVARPVRFMHSTRPARPSRRCSTPRSSIRSSWWGTATVRRLRRSSPRRTPARGCARWSRWRRTSSSRTLR